MPIDKQEARDLLRQILEPYRSSGYRELRKLVGHCESRVENGPSGARYRVECFVNRIHPRDDTVSVSAIASELGRRGWLPSQIELGFRVLSDDTIC